MHDYYTLLYFLADHVTAVVQDLFPVINVVDLLTIYRVLKGIQN